MAEEGVINEPQRQKGLAEISSGKETPLLKLKRSLYESILKLFPQDLPHEKNLKNQKTRFVLLEFLKTFQVISMLDRNTDLHLWSSYSFLWEFFRYFRLDYLSDELSIYMHVLYVTEGLLLTSSFLFAYTISRNYRGNPPHIVVITLVRYIFALMAEMLYIPAQVFLVRANFYLLIGSEHEHSTLNLPGTILALVCLYGIRLVYIIGKTDIKHRNKRVNILSKAHSDFEIYEFKTRVVSVSFYILRGDELPIYFAILVGLSELYVASMYFKELPYYNKFTNKVKSVSHLTVSFLSFAMLLGRLMDNAGVAFIISVIGVPISIVAVLMTCNFAVQKNYSVINHVTKAPGKVRNIYQLERNLRSMLIHDTDKDKTLILDAFSAYFMVSAFNKEGLLAIWQSNYCMSSLKDFRLARIRLSMYLLSSSSLESDYQYFVCNKALELDNYHDDVEFLRFKIYLEKTIQLDKKFCLQYHNVLREFSESPPKVNKIEELLMKINKNLKTLKSSYSQLMSMYPENSEVFRMYNTFLLSILTDKNKAVFIEQMHNGARRESKTEVLEFFNEDNGFLIISGELNSLGTISYVNPKAAEILNDSMSGVTGQPLNHYLPKSVSPVHNHYLKRFLMNCKSNRIDLPGSMFLSTGIGFLKEVYMRFRCVVVKHYPFFLVLIKEKFNYREAMILDEDNLMTGHTQGLPKMLNFPVKSMVGYCTEYFLPQVNTLLPSNPIEISDQVFLEYKPKKIRSTIMRVYYLYTECKLSDCDDRSLRYSKISKSPRNIRFKDTFSENKGLRRDSKSRHASIMENAKNEKKILKIINQSKYTLKILRLSLILLVAFMGITLTSCSLYVVYGYDSKTIYEILFDLTKSKSSMLAIAELARTERLSQDMPIYLSVINNIDFSYEIKNIENFRSISEEAFDRYPNCESLKDVFHSNNPFWFQGSIKKDNIVNIMGAFVSYSYKYFEGDKSQEIYEFIINNGVGRPFEYIDEVEMSIQHCANEAIDYFNLMILVFFMIDGIIIGVFVMINTIFLVRFRNLCQSHWEKMMETFALVYLNIQSTLLNRLEEIHEMEHTANQFKSISRAKMNVPKISIAKSMIKYAYIVVLFIVYLSCVYLIFDRNLIDSITYRRNFCFQLEKTGSMAQELGWWTRESLLQDTRYSLCKSFEGECAFKPSSDSLMDIQNNIKILFKKFQLKTNMQITEHETDILFKEFIVQNKKYYSGMNGFVSSLIMDSRHYASTQSDSPVFYELIKNYLNSQREFFSEVIDTTEETTSTHRTNMVLFNSTFTICNFITITLFLLRYIQTQKFYIKHRSNFYKLISNDFNNAKPP